MAGEDGKTFDLDQVIREGMQQFTGQESAMTIQPPGEAEVRDPGSEVSDKTEKEQTKVDDLKAEGAAAAGASAGKGKEEGDGEKAGEHAAEAGAGKEAEAEKQKAQERITALETENRELKQEKAAATIAAVRKNAETKFETSVREFSQTENKKALAAIEKLDPDDFETPEKYQEEVAKIWAEKDVAVTRHTNAVRSQVASEVRKATETEAGGQRSEVSKDATAKDTAKTTHTWEEVAQIAAGTKDEKGNPVVDPNDPTFKLFCAEAPTQDKDGKPLDFNAQVQWAIDETKNLNRLRQLDRESKNLTAEQLAERRQTIDQPLERGSTTIPGNGGPSGARETTSQKAVSLNDALDFAAQKRTL